MKYHPRRFKQGVRPAYGMVVNGNIEQSNEKGVFMYSSGLLKWTRAASLSIVAFFSASASGKVWYVDDDNFNTPGTDGLTEATAFGTIQEAVNAASSDDIVMVAAGTYDQGSTQDGFTKSMANRVYIDKSLTLLRNLHPFKRLFLLS